MQIILLLQIQILDGSKKFQLIEGFHCGTFRSNFDVNVAILVTQDTLWRLRQQCKKRCFYALDSCTSCIFVCYRLAGASDNICKLREAVDDVTRIIAALSHCCLNRHNVFLVTKMAANLHVYVKV